MVESMEKIFDETCKKRANLGTLTFLTRWKFGTIDKYRSIPQQFEIVVMQRGKCIYTLLSSGATKQLEDVIALFNDIKGAVSGEKQKEV